MMRCAFWITFLWFAGGLVVTTIWLIHRHIVGDANPSYTVATLFTAIGIFQTPALSVYGIRKLLR